MTDPCNGSQNPGSRDPHGGPPPPPSPLETPAPADTTCRMTATALAKKTRAGDLGVVEIVAAHLARLRRLDPEINSVCTLDDQRAMDRARILDQMTRGEGTPPLLGVPVLICDLHHVEGMTTTRGSSLFAGVPAPAHDLHVARLLEAGAVVLGKTNVPELGIGAHTHNRVSGATRNPRDTQRTVGGASAAGAAAVACGFTPLADAIDLGGSMRAGGSFCGVVALTPSLGRVPSALRNDGWQTLAQVGPIARNVADAALMLSVMEGPDPRTPLSLEAPRLDPTTLDSEPSRWIAAKPESFGNLAPETGVTAAFDGALGKLAELGVEIAERRIDLRGAGDVYKILDAWRLSTRNAELLRRRRNDLDANLAWQIEQGLQLNGLVLAQAQAGRTRLLGRILKLLDTADVMVLPTTRVPPFSVRSPWAMELDAVRDTRLQVLGLSGLLSMLGLPVATVPCGFTPDGLPVGLQVVGPPRADLTVLRFARLVEQARGFEVEVLEPRR
ncbi:MAG TPA: amidase family protein [Thermoanaerobaculia bacterium]|nr:amidase family protein [Thermoanaerobaculia bacterium]